MYLLNFVVCLHRMIKGMKNNAKTKVERKEH